MSLTWIPAVTAAVVGALDKRRLPRTIGAVLAGLVLVIVGAVSLFGDAEDGEPKQVMHIEPQPRTGVGGPILEASASVDETLAPGEKLAGDLALVEPSVAGPLPRIGADGRKPMNVYSRAYVPAPGTGPKVAIVVGGLGLGNALLDASLKRLPQDVSLAFTPYSLTLNKDVSAARAAGHEVLLEIPMEPQDYPSVNPGIHTLTVGATEKNTKRLRWLMTRVTGYAGLINTFGNRFLTAKDDTSFVMSETALRGLMFVETGVTPESVAQRSAIAAGAPYAHAEFIIDKSPTREAVEKELAALEVAAKQRGVAIGVTGALPVTIDRLATWLATLKAKGITLVPVSALVRTDAAALPVASAPRPAAVAPAPKPRRVTTQWVEEPAPARRRRAATSTKTKREWWTTEPASKPKRSPAKEKATVTYEETTTTTTAAPHP